VPAHHLGGGKLWSWRRSRGHMLLNWEL
jgi:hypothetical protein